MSYKKEAKRQQNQKLIDLSNQEKAQKFAESLKIKLSKMSPAQQKFFIEKLNNKLELIIAEIKDCNQNSKKLSSFCPVRYLNEGASDVIIMFTTIACVAASTITVGAVLKTESLADYLIGTSFSAVLGTLGGTLAAYGIDEAVSNKIISKPVNNLRKKINYKKIKKLKKQANQIETQINLTKEITNIEK